MESSEENNEQIMRVIYLQQIEKKRIKIDKVEDYYELFVRMLKVENKDLHTHEHLWVLGIDKMGYSACLYIVSLGYSSFSTVDPMKIFRIALQADSVKIIIAQSKPNDSKLELNDADFNLTNAIYHKSLNLGLELVDHIVISNLSIESKTPLYYSYIEHELIKFIAQDITYKTVNESREELDKEKEDAMEEGIDKGKIIGGIFAKQEEKLEIAKKMLSDNEDISKILKYTELTMIDIEKIKEYMGLQE